MKGPAPSVCRFSADTLGGPPARSTPGGPSAEIRAAGAPPGPLGAGEIVRGVGEPLGEAFRSRETEPDCTEFATLLGTPAVTRPCRPGDAWMPTRCTLDRGADVGAGRRAAVVKATTGRVVGWRRASGKEEVDPAG